MSNLSSSSRGVVTTLILMGAALVSMKLLGSTYVATWPWWLVTAPWWGIFAVLAVLALLACLCIALILLIERLRK